MSVVVVDVVVVGVFGGETTVDLRIVQIYLCHLVKYSRHTAVRSGQAASPRLLFLCVSQLK